MGETGMEGRAQAGVEGRCKPADLPASSGPILRDLSAVQASNLRAMEGKTCPDFCPQCTESFGNTGDIQARWPDKISMKSGKFGLGLHKLRARKRQKMPHILAHHSRKEAIELSLLASLKSTGRSYGIGLCHPCEFGEMHRPIVRNLSVVCRSWTIIKGVLKSFLMVYEEAFLGNDLERGGVQ